MKGGNRFSTSDLLRELEERDLVEMIDDGSTSNSNALISGTDNGTTGAPQSSSTGTSACAYYRFNVPFMSNTLYEMQPFEIAKKGIHEQII